MNVRAEGTVSPGAEVQLADLTCRYGEFTAVDQANLTIAPGEFVTLLGASGSGKTTTLMMIAGFIAPSRGDVLINGRSVVDTPPDRRNLGVVFQNYALFPHMTVTENIGFPLRMRRVNRARAREMISEALAMVHLTGLNDRRISELSGGQQQRVALARALVYRPPVLLMDEPLGALDRKLRGEIQVEIKRIQRNLNITVVYVTHDQEEALVMSDRIAIMRSGKIEQVDTPARIYEEPASAFVADFLGESNFLPGKVLSATPEKTVIDLDCGHSITARSSTFRKGDRVRIMVRPEAISISNQTKDDGTTNFFNGVIDEIEYLGQSIRCFLVNQGYTITARIPRREALRFWDRGSLVAATWHQNATLIFPEM